MRGAVGTASQIRVVVHLTVLSRGAFGRQAEEPVIPTRYVLTWQERLNRCAGILPWGENGEYGENLTLGRGFHGFHGSHCFHRLGMMADKLGSGRRPAPFRAGGSFYNPQTLRKFSSHGAQLRFLESVLLLKSPRRQEFGLLVLEDVS